MDLCLSYRQFSSFLLQSLPSAVRTSSSPLLSFSFNLSGNCTRRISFGGRTTDCRRVAVVVATSSSSHWGEYSGLNTPLEPRSAAGRLLSSVLLDDRKYFPQLAEKQLEQLAVDRDDARARMYLSLRSDEACLHRRIAELKVHQCQTAVEDVMYLLICFKFYEIRVHLIPQLSKCIYNGRLEIWPSKDWELESIHSFEVLEMMRDHLTACVGWRANSNVTDKWMKTQVPRLELCQVYTASVLFGYFLKSVCLRQSLEESLSQSQINFNLGINVGQMWSPGSKNVVSGHVMGTRSASLDQVPCTQGKKQDDLKCYLMGFDSKTLQMCAKPQSKEAVRLIEEHSSALFGDKETGLLDTNEEISTSFATLKRFVLEAVAFGSFLWEAEKYVNTLYQLEEN